MCSNPLIMPWVTEVTLLLLAGGRVTARSLCVQAVGGGLSGLAAQFSDESALEVCIHVMRYTNRRLYFLLFGKQTTHAVYGMCRNRGNRFQQCRLKILRTALFHQSLVQISNVFLEKLDTTVFVNSEIKRLQNFQKYT